MTNRKDKKRLRDLKRKIKRSGNKKARADLKRDLANNPEEAHFGEIQRGKRRSENLNGMDYDSKRKKKKSSNPALYNPEDGGIIPPSDLEGTNDGEGQKELPPLRPGEQGDS